MHCNCVELDSPHRVHASLLDDRPAWVHVGEVGPDESPEDFLALAVVDRVAVVGVAAGTGVLADLEVHAHQCKVRS